jgi:hypothetical protein
MAETVRVSACVYGVQGFLLVEPVDGGCAVRCVLCGVVGPVRKTAETARKALLMLGARNQG